MFFNCSDCGPLLFEKDQSIITVKPKSFLLHFLDLTYMYPRAHTLQLHNKKPPCIIKKTSLLHNPGMGVVEQ